MKDKKSSIDYHEHEENRPIPICSATDCTGLIPSLPESEAEIEFYEEIYPFLTPAWNQKEGS